QLSDPLLHSRRVRAKEVLRHLVQRPQGICANRLGELLARLGERSDQGVAIASRIGVGLGEECQLEDPLHAWMFGVAPKLLERCCDRGGWKSGAEEVAQR